MSQAHGGEPTEWSSSREMNALEAGMWRAEGDPRLRETLVAVLVLDRAPDWERLLEAHEWASRMVPRFRQRVVEPFLGLGNPVWATNASVDLAYHVRRVRLPAPGSMRQLLDLTQSIAMRPLDPARPLWEGALVEGLEDGRAAYVLKSHHSITDGLGSVQMFSMLFSRTREHREDRPEPPIPPAEVPSRLGEAARQVTGGLLRLPDWAAATSTRAADRIGRALQNPDQAVVDLADFGRRLAQTARPPGDGSPLLRNRSLSWRFEALEVPLADLRAAAKAAGGSVNDAYLAAALGGFRRYHEHFNVHVDAIPVSIPVSLRTSQDARGGNRFGAVRFAAPVGEPDPAERIQQIREQVLEARGEMVDVLGIAAPVLSHLPPPLLSRLSIAVTGAHDAQLSNIPGIPFPVYVAGAEVLRLFPFGPLPGCAAMIAMVSHNGTCCIGLNVDRAAVTDPGLLRECFVKGFDEVLALGAPAETSAKKGRATRSAGRAKAGTPRAAATKAQPTRAGAAAAGKAAPRRSAAKAVPKSVPEAADARSAGASEAGTEGAPRPDGATGSTGIGSPAEP